MSIRVRYHKPTFDSASRVYMLEWMPDRPPVTGLLREQRIILMNYQMVGYSR